MFVFEIRHEYSSGTSDRQAVWLLWSLTLDSTRLSHFCFSDIFSVSAPQGEIRCSGLDTPGGILIIWIIFNLSRVIVILVSSGGNCGVFLPHIPFLPRTMNYTYFVRFVKGIFMDFGKPLEGVFHLPGSTQDGELYPSAANCQEDFDCFSFCSAKNGSTTSQVKPPSAV
jgi:hypothetical protein